MKAFRSTASLRWRSWITWQRASDWEKYTSKMSPIVSDSMLFKVLGGSFAMARYIAKQTGKDVSELPYNVLTSEELKKEFGQATFFTATDGNHGRGVAWAANKLGQKAVVLMPKGSTQTRLNNILAEGAQATIEEYNYDECVRMGKCHGGKDRKRRHGAGYCMGRL